MLDSHFHALILWSKHHIFGCQTDHYPEGCLYFIHTAKFVLLDKCRRECLPRRLKRKSLEFSHAVTISRLRKSAEASRTKQKLTFKFSTLFTAKDVDFKHFKVFRTKYIEMNIEWTIMGKPVLISKLQDWCYGITVYRCRALINILTSLTSYDPHPHPTAQC